MKFNDFSLAYRFTDPNYDELPRRVVDSFKVVAPKRAQVLWKKCVHDTALHLCERGAAVTLDHELSRFELDTDRFDLGCKLLNEAVSAPVDATVVLFWSPRHALETTWRIFVNHWTAFWYPSDDNNVVVVPSAGVRIEFVEERAVVFAVSACDQLTSTRSSSAPRSSSMKLDSNRMTPPPSEP